MSGDGEGAPEQEPAASAAGMVPIFDGHNDALGRLHDARAPGGLFAQGRPDGHVDLPRARQGGLFGGFYAAFVPTPPGADGEPQEKAEPAGPAGKPPGRVMTQPGTAPYAFPLTAPVDAALARRETDSMVKRWEQLCALRDPQGKRQVRPVLASADLELALRGGEHAMLLHFEGAEAIAPDTSNLESYYARGLRSVGLVWSRRNAFGHGVPFAYPASPDQGPGLSPAGLELVRRCAELGIAVDLSHLNAAGFWDVARLALAPLMVTHAAVHRLCPKPRNLLDEQIAEVGRTGGVVGLNFNCADVRPDGRWLSQTPLLEHLRHLEALLELAGEDSVALGSDFDGALMPRELSDASALQNLIAVLRTAGWREGLIEKVAWRNWSRVLHESIG